MNKTIIILSLLVFSLLSCVSSCNSCQSVTHAVNLPCDSSACNTDSTKLVDVIESSASDSFSTESVEVKSSLLDHFTEVSMCTLDPSLNCQPLDNFTSVKTELVKGDTWQINLPLGLQRKPIPKAEIVLSAFLHKDKVLVFLLKEKFAGTFEQYTLHSLRGIKDTGSTIQSSAMVELNGTKFSLLQTIKDDVKIWNLVTTKNGFGYGLSCGGSASYDATHIICTSITSTFTLK